MGQAAEQNEWDLTAAIIVKKQEMIQLGLKYGLADIQTVQCSQQLDDLLNRFAKGDFY
ncbi:Spo0E family sporulation regulatory protein-aspartic acid phosphatase [Virgibacillus xinjiangensis]|uniref:Spo0E family sporulation regulatory protein-aspartic acid phosphatase n=1 Tax=Virgibacillus xinjiangensis TaxID=393090 RepID=A0ABV7CQZ9_9BACI